MNTHEQRKDLALALSEAYTARKAEALLSMAGVILAHIPEDQIQRLHQDLVNRGFINGDKQA